MTSPSSAVCYCTASLHAKRATRAACKRLHPSHYIVFHACSPRPALWCCVIRATTAHLMALWTCQVIACCTTGSVCAPLRGCVKLAHQKSQPLYRLLVSRLCAMGHLSRTLHRQSKNTYWSLVITTLGEQALGPTIHPPIHPRPHMVHAHSHPHATCLSMWALTW